MIIKNCLWCKKEFKVFPCFKNQQCCSKSCSGKYLCIILDKNPFKGRHHTKEWKRKKSKEFSGKNHPLYGHRSYNWKGGKKIDHYGYVYIWKPEHPKNQSGYVAEHRLIMEKLLNRFLNSYELIHHIDHNKQNNLPENLILINRSKHAKKHKLSRWKS